jgi:3-phytase/alkaline phosphatase D
MSKAAWTIHDRSEKGVSFIPPKRGLMRIRRLILVALALVTVILIGPAFAADQPAFPNGVAAGDVTQTSAVLWARAATAGKLTFEYAADEQFSRVLGRLTAEVTDAMQPVKVAVGGLAPNTAYYYRGTDSAGHQAAGRFRTPADKGMKAGLRFGVSGDWRGELSPYPAIANVPARDLALFIGLGDTIYADFPSPNFNKKQARTLAEYRIKHDEVYSVRYGLNTWAALRASTAVLATIDDHEVTNDFAGGAAPASDKRFAAETGAFINETAMYNNGLQGFQEYNPIRDEFYGDTGDPRTAGKRKLYRFRTYGGDAAFFLLDARSFRNQGLPAVTALNRDTIAAYLAASFQPGRTMLGKPQLDDLKTDLRTAQADGITWKFVLAPEPVQNFGVLNASDRFEGYAAERTELMKFIVDNQITNVVFVAADIHGTVVNNLTYQESPTGPQLPMGAFEISTGAVAFDAPFGPTVMGLAARLKFLSDQQLALYKLAPLNLKESILTRLIDAQITPFGYDPVGLDGSSIDAKLVEGGYVATHTYGWTEFEIDAATQQLRVTTYGIPHYTQAQLDADPQQITALKPAVVSAFTVTPKGS